MVNHPAGEYRAELDFEITFSNGGSLRGREFRIDIEHPGMTEEELAEALIRDLGLLMTDRVDIHSRQVMRAPHRRAPHRPALLEPLPEPGVRQDLPARDDTPAGEDGPAREDGQAPAGPGTLRRADLSHVIEDGMITYPGLPVPQIRPDSVSALGRATYAPGVEFRIGEVTICGNTGTYLDSPFHRYADADDLSELPLSKLAELDGLRVDVRGSRQRAIGRSQLLPYDCRGKAVLIHTGWARHWGTGEYFRNHPFLTADAATYLAGTGAVLVGIDSLNIDDTGDPERPVHSLLLAAGIPVCEHLTGLDALPGAGFRFSAVPPKLRPFGTFPVRAYATW